MSLRNWPYVCHNFTEESLVPLLHLHGAAAVQHCECKYGGGTMYATGNTLCIEAKLLLDPQEEVLRWLLEHTPRKEARELVCEALERAVSHSRTRAVSILLRSGVIKNYMLSEVGDDLLSQSCAKGNIGIAAHLLARGVEPTSLDLRHAVSGHHVNLAICLLNAGVQQTLWIDWPGLAPRMSLEMILVLYTAGICNFTARVAIMGAPEWMAVTKPSCLHAQVTRTMLVRATEAARDGVAMTVEGRRDLNYVFLTFVYRRVIEICIGLQALQLPALCTCDIVQELVGPKWPLVPFHVYWNIVTTVKHFRE